MSEIHSLKQQLRQVIRQRKQQYSLEQRQAWSREIEQALLAHPRLQAASVVMLYYALPDEVDTRQLADTLLKKGKTVILPKCVDKQHIEPRQYTAKDTASDADADTTTAFWHKCRRPTRSACALTSNTWSRCPSTTTTR